MDAKPDLEVGLEKSGCSVKTCPGMETSKTTTGPDSAGIVCGIDGDVKKGCCIGKIATSSSSCSSTDNKANASVSPTALDSISLPRVDDLDVENGSAHVEHLVLSVQGMTCTGCEKKLYNTLVSLQPISNVKTSLVFSTAEFDLRPSTSVNSGNIVQVVKRMTGFTCTKLAASEGALDLIVDNVLEFSKKDLPYGIVDVVVLHKNTIRISYNPRTIGARDLLATPFFRQARLGPVVSSPVIASGRTHLRLLSYRTLASSLLTLPVLVLAWAPLPEHKVLYGAISLGFATIVQTAIAAPFYVNALKALLFSRMIEMDMLIVLSTTTAYIYSIIAYGYLVVGESLLTGQFFETSTLLVTLIMVGRTVSCFARQKALETISIESLQTPTALLVDPETGQEREIDARLLQYGDMFKVWPDTTVVTDGVVVIGETVVDESLISGEAALVTKQPGTPVIAGSINHSGILTVRLTRLPHENTIRTIDSMVDEGKASRPKIQEIADRVASIFIPVILIVVLLIFVIWIAVGILVLHENPSATSINAMTYAISALIVSCPCAIGLAVPMVVVIASSVAAKHGLIFKSAETIEIARDISHVIFDKTGTLTQGRLSVVSELYPTNEVDSVTSLILRLTTNSKHPVSAAIANHLAASGIQPSNSITNITSIPGAGIEAIWKNSTIRAGNPHWLNLSDSRIIQPLLSQGLTTFCITLNDTLVAVFGLKDQFRPQALCVINQLKKRGIEISILSGDNGLAVHNVARELGIPERNVRSRCTPAEKALYVKEASSIPNSNSIANSASIIKNKKLKGNNIVLFCGDGTNDAPALATASIGMHVCSPSSGGITSSLAQSAADLVLFSPSLSNILLLIDLSKAFHRRVMFNFVWCAIYNVFAVSLAAGAFTGLSWDARIQPQWAGLGEVVSVLPVVLVAVGLRWVRF